MTSLVIADPNDCIVSDTRVVDRVGSVQFWEDSETASTYVSDQIIKLESSDAYIWTRLINTSRMLSLRRCMLGQSLRRL